MLYRFRFVWNKATHRHRHARKIVGLALVTEEESTKGHFRTVWLDAKVLLKGAAVAAVVGWFVAAGALWFWLDRSPHNRVGYPDLIFPWRWSQIAKLRGQGYLDAGSDYLRNGRIAEGLFAMRQGLVRHPDAAVARLNLARLYARSGHYAGVRDVMLPQLKLTPPPADFVRFLVEVAATFDDHLTVLAACERRLAAGAAPGTSERGWLFEQKAAALLALEKPAEALEALDAAGRDRSLDWRRLRIMALLAGGRAGEAVAEVRAWPAGGVPPEFRLQLLASASRKAGQTAEMTAALRELQRLHPSEPQPWAEAIGHYVRAGMRDAAWNELQDALRRFDAKPAAVALLERAGMDAGAPELVARCVETAREFGRPLILPLFNLAAAQLATGDAAAAARTFDWLLAEDRRLQARPAAPAALTAGSAARPDDGRLLGVVTGAGAAGGRLSPPMRDYLRTLLDGLAQPAGDRAEAHCAVLAQGPFRLGAFTGSADILAKAGRWPAVEAVARTGLKRFPGSTQLTRWSARAAENIAAMPPPAPPAAPVAVKPAARPVTAAGPAPVAPAPPGAKALGQEEFFAQLDARVSAGDWTGAGELVRAVRGAAPPWLANVESDLAWREVRYAFERDDRPELLVLVGQRVRLHKSEVTRAMDVARWYRDRGDAWAARQVVSRVLQEIPGYVPGQKFLQEL